MKRNESTEANSAYQSLSVVFSDVHNYAEMNDNRLGRHVNNIKNRNTNDADNGNYQQVSAVPSETHVYTELNNTVRG